MSLLEAFVLSYQDPKSELQKLKKEAKEKGQKSYLRLGFGELNKTSIGHKYVLEIWPEHSESTIHNHGLAYGVVMMLHGNVDITIYDDVQNKNPIALTTLKAEDITYMTNDFL